jgi:hypothetical protein
MPAPPETVNPNDSDRIDVTLWRRTHSRVPDAVVRGQSRFIGERTLSRATGWSFTRSRIADPRRSEDDGWFYRIDYRLQATEPDAVPAAAVRVFLDVARKNYQRFKDAPYEWDDAPTREEYAEAKRLLRRSKNGSREAETGGEAVADPKFLRPHEIVLPSELLRDREAIDRHHAFRGIYGRSAHIRRALLAINAFRHSAQVALDRGDREADLARNHVLFYGPPAGAKTRIMRGLRRVLPAGSFISLDAPSLTAAGLVDLFLTTYYQNCPPIVFVDEFEKVETTVLIKWLEMLDERAELSKNNYRVKRNEKVPFLCIAACNGKERLDRVLHGSISSRFPVPIYVPRPDDSEIRSILNDQIKEVGGNPEWADECLRLMEMFSVTDPRLVKGWLIDENGLLDGSAAADLNEIYGREREDRGFVIESTGDPYEDSLAQFHAHRLLNESKRHR